MRVAASHADMFAVDTPSMVMITSDRRRPAKPAGESLGGGAATYSREGAADASPPPLLLLPLAAVDPLAAAAAATGDGAATPTSPPPPLVGKSIRPSPVTSYLDSAAIPSGVKSLVYGSPSVFNIRRAAA